MAKMHYPTQNTFRLGFTLPSNSTRVFGAIDRDLSRINHRLYRQSRYYQMKVDIDADLPDGSTVFVYALQDTWMNQKAYQMAYEAFLKNSAEESSQLRSGAKARWHDFRVDHGIAATASDSDSIPVGYSAPGVTPAGTQYTVGEYVLSEVTDAAGTARTFRWLGTGGNTFNIVDEYDRTGNTNAQPSTASTTAAYANLEDEIDANQLEHLSDDGNLPPYAQSTIENQVLTLVATLHVDSTGTSKLSSGFFNAPCGIYFLAFAGGLDGNTANDGILITAKSGDYKGVSAPTMLKDAAVYASSKKSSGASHNVRLR